VLGTQAAAHGPGSGASARSCSCSASREKLQLPNESSRRPGARSCGWRRLAGRAELTVSSREEFCLGAWEPLAAWLLFSAALGFYFLWATRPKGVDSGDRRGRRPSLSCYQMRVKTIPPPSVEDGLPYHPKQQQGARATVGWASLSHPLVSLPDSYGFSPRPSRRPPVDDNLVGQRWNTITLAPRTQRPRDSIATGFNP
jgi:hypothetical protein